MRSEWTLTEWLLAVAILALVTTSLAGFALAVTAWRAYLTWAAHESQLRRGERESLLNYAIEPSATAGHSLATGQKKPAKPLRAQKPHNEMTIQEADRRIAEQLAQRGVEIETG